MTDLKLNRKTRPNPESRRKYESDTMALHALRLIAAPDPKDDLTDEEIAAYMHKHNFSSAMIQQIIAAVKSI